MKHFALAAAMIAGTVGYASAATVTYTTLTSPAVVDISNEELAFDAVSLTLPQFDSSMGLLTSVTIDWYAELSGNVSVTKDAQAGTLFIAQAYSNLEGTGPSSLNISLTPVGTLFNNVYFNANETKVFGATANADEQDIFTSADGAAFLAFIGTGDVEYLFDGNEVSGGYGQGGASYNPSLFADVTATITYTYDVPSSAVPVPAALPLLGGGLAVMAFVARRRKA